MSTSIDKATSSTTERFTGRVKWFNNKAGYGFITITDGSSAGTDIFVHHSVIGVGSQQFRYLVQGEYVDFNLVPTTQGSSHDIQASNVCGSKGGKLMCETRHEYKVAKGNYKPEPNERFSEPNERFSESNERFSEPVKMPRQKSIFSTKNFESGDNKEWSTINKKQTTNKFQNKK